MQSSTEDRFRGCLVGLAVGDALGGPVELMTPEEITAKYGGQLTTMAGGGWLRLAPGEYTDDTELMLCMAESIATRGGWEANDVIRRFMAWYDRSPKDVGGITDSALSRMKRGMSWRDATYAAHLEHKGASAGNGAVMRAAPLALLHCHDPRTLMIDSRESARLTHWNDLCAHSASALNLVTAALLLGSSLEAGFNAVRQFVGRAEPRIVTTIERAHDPDVRLSTTGFVLDTLTIAWYALIHTSDFEEAVTLAVNLGGDADTQGALAGTLAGALYGEQAIPQEWRTALHNRDHIETLASRLYSLAEARRSTR